MIRVLQFRVVEVAKRSSKLTGCSDDAFLEVIQIVSSVDDLIERQLLKDHIIVSECSSLVAKQVLDTSEFFRNGAIPAYGLGKDGVVADLVGEVGLAEV